MKLLAMMLFMFSPFFARAEVAALFPQDQAILIIQGNDSDAVQLYDAMNVDPDDDGKIYSKHIAYETMYAKSVFDLTCRKSQLAGNASCTLKFFSPEAVIIKDQKAVLMGINDQFDAPSMAKLFNQTSSNPYQAEVFLSADGKLRIWKTFNSSGNVVSFTMKYN